MIALFLLLVIAAIVLGIVGVVAKGLLYLLFIGIVVFLGALLLGALRMRRRPGIGKHKMARHRGNDPSETTTKEIQMTDVHSQGEDPVAVLGTGIMGSAMARNLVGAGLRTTVWDRSPSATASLSEAGALVAASPAEAIRGARLVITMLPTAAVVESVIFGDGVAQAFTQDAVWAQMGTIGVG